MSLQTLCGQSQKDIAVGLGEQMLRATLNQDSSPRAATETVLPSSLDIVQQLNALSELDSNLSHTDMQTKHETVSQSQFDSGIPLVANNVEVQHVNTIPFPSIEAHSMEPDFFSGVPLPTRREFTERNFVGKCPVCDKTFSTYQGLMRHIDHHRGRYPYFCSICGRGFMTKDHMGNHMRGHTGERLYCFCGAAFKTHQALRMHKKREHQDFSVTCDESKPGELDSHCEN